MKGHFIIGAVALLLGSCGSNPPKPERSCTQLGEKEYCGRGGCYRECLKRGISCPEPLELAERPEGELYCRLKKE